MAQATSNDIPSGSFLRSHGKAAKKKNELSDDAISNKRARESGDDAFRFFSLPPEIRIMIYELVLPEKVKIVPSSPDGLVTNDLALLRTSRQLRDETRRFLLTTSTIRVRLQLRTRKAIDDFLKLIREEGDPFASSIRNLEIEAIVGGYVHSGAMYFVRAMFDFGEPTSRSSRQGTVWRPSLVSRSLGCPIKLPSDAVHLDSWDRSVSGRAVSMRRELALIPWSDSFSAQSIEAIFRAVRSHAKFSIQGISKQEMERVWEEGSCEGSYYTLYTRFWNQHQNV